MHLQFSTEILKITVEPSLNRQLLNLDRELVSDTGFVQLIPDVYIFNIIEKMFKNRTGVTDTYGETKAVPWPRVPKSYLYHLHLKKKSNIDKHDLGRGWGNER